ncbi:hypothetical protein GF378_03230 [Candidatus Pacearchaeota archaeon]|nr:hypothetical protein [Candidatus Pacearchaeota archaeon]
MSVIKNKKAISGIVAAVIMIALVMVLGVVVWNVISNLVSEELESAGTCFEVFDKVNLNNKYTCWNSSANEILFSVKVGDVDITKIVVSVSAAGQTKSYTLSDEENDNLVYFPSGDSGVVKPGKNEGLTYITDEFNTAPDSISIYPVVGDQQCDVSDTISNIGSCILLG